MLVVFGIHALGRREILDCRVADSVSENTWGDLFRELKARCRHGVLLVTSDTHSGIRSGLTRHFQGVCWQRCQVHFKRELAGKVSYKQRAELMKDVRAVLMPQERAECLRRGEEMAVKWAGRYPAVAKLLREGLEDCLTVLACPAEHRVRLSSTNLAENLMKQLKQRTRVVGVFPSRSSCERLIGALLLEVHEQWQVADQCYFNMELWR
jgi:transposase-like protein